MTQACPTVGEKRAYHTVIMLKSFQDINPHTIQLPQQSLLSPSLGTSVVSTILLLQGAHTP